MRGAQGRTLLRTESTLMGEMLSRNLDDPDANPYFLWSETVAELRDVLAGAQGAEQQAVYMARIYRVHSRRVRSSCAAGSLCSS